MTPEYIGIQNVIVSVPLNNILFLSALFIVAGIRSPFSWNAKLVGVMAIIFPVKVAASDSSGRGLPKYFCLKIYVSMA